MFTTKEYYYAKALERLEEILEDETNGMSYEGILEDLVMLRTQIYGLRDVFAVFDTYAISDMSKEVNEEIVRIFAIIQSEKDDEDD